LIIQASFLVVVAIFLLSMLLVQKKHVKWALTICLFITITIPNFSLCGGYQFAKLLGINPVGEILERRQNDLNALKDLVKWAKSETTKTSLFTFLTGNESDCYYFKVKAERSTMHTKNEVIHLAPLRKRKALIQQLKEIENARKSRNIKKILKIAQKFKVDYFVVRSKGSDNIFISLTNIPVFKNNSFIVYSVSEIL
jgi:hypothetical protein